MPASPVLARAPRRREAPLEDLTREHQRREEALGRERKRLRRERDQAIRQAYRDGLPLQDIAEIVGLSHQYISRIVRG
jgi:DNA-directed RNA polymerase specialized sigma subunit